MTTRCLITVQSPDQRYLSIYCHHDGYNHEGGVGPMLRQYFNSQELAESLIALGDVSYIHADNIYAYHRDGNSPWEHTQPKISKNLDEVGELARDYRASFLYLFSQGKWTANALH